MMAHSIIYLGNHHHTQSTQCCDTGNFVPENCSPHVPFVFESDCFNHVCCDSENLAEWTLLPVYATQESDPAIGENPVGHEAVGGRIIWWQDKQCQMGSSS